MPGAPRVLGSLENPTALLRGVRVPGGLAVPSWASRHVRDAVPLPLQRTRSLEARAPCATPALPPRVTARGRQRLQILSLAWASGRVGEWPRATRRTDLTRFHVLFSRLYSYLSGDLPEA